MKLTSLSVAIVSTYLAFCSCGEDTTVEPTEHVISPCIQNHINQAPNSVHITRIDEYKKGTRYFYMIKNGNVNSDDIIPYVMLTEECSNYCLAYSTNGMPCQLDQFTFIRTVYQR